MLTLAYVGDARLMWVVDHPLISIVGSRGMQVMHAQGKRVRDGTLPYLQLMKKCNMEV
jgi:hypothetical protein